MSEIDTLRARVAELEAQCVNRLQENFTFAYCIIFLRNSNERLRAIKLTADAFGIGFAAARDWVDSVRMERRVIDMSAARKTMEEYPSDISDAKNRIEYSISHWPALSSTAGTELLARVKELEKDKATLDWIEAHYEHLWVNAVQSDGEFGPIAFYKDRIKGGLRSAVKSAMANASSC